MSDDPISELCPHCLEYFPCNRADEHVATDHADLPPCTATLSKEYYGLFCCVFRAGHAKGRGEFGGSHASAHGPAGRHVWNDSMDGATPHREETVVGSPSPAAEALLVAFDETQLAEMHAAASARIKRVRALHVREYETCDWCSTNDRHVVWPCPTIQALDGEEPS